MQEELLHTQTYKLSNVSEADLITSHHSYYNNYNLTLKDSELKLPTLYWIPKLHKSPYGARFISNSVSCTTKQISILLTACLTAIKHHVQAYSSTVYINSNKNIFWSIKNSGEFLSILSKKRFNVSSVNTYDFSTLYTKLPHNLIKEKLNALIQHTFSREEKIGKFLACNDKKAFFTDLRIKGNRHFRPTLSRTAYF